MSKSFQTRGSGTKYAGTLINFDSGSNSTSGTTSSDKGIGYKIAYNAALIGVTHGNFCGAGYVNGKMDSGARVDPKIKAVDAVDAACKVHDATFGIAESFGNADEREAAMAFADHLLAKTLDRTDYSGVSTWGTIYGTVTEFIMYRLGGSDKELLKRGAALMLPHLNSNKIEPMKKILSRMENNTKTYDDHVPSFTRAYTKSLANGYEVQARDSENISEFSTNQIAGNFEAIEQKYDQDTQNRMNASAAASSSSDAVSKDYQIDVKTNIKPNNSPVQTPLTEADLANMVNNGVLATNSSFSIANVNGTLRPDTGAINPMIVNLSSDSYGFGGQSILTDLPSNRVNFATLDNGTIRIMDVALAASSNPYVLMDPLVLDLDGDGVELLLFGAKETYFDTDNDGYKERTGWVNKDDGILVHDLNGNGKIDDITETVSEYYKAPKGGGSLGGPASNPFKSGFDALKTLDSNGDGVINASDSAWSQLRVWQDTNGDGVSHSTGINPVSELKTLTSLGITEIKLANKADGSFISGNEVRANGSYTMNGTSKTVASVNLLSNTFGLVESSNPSGASLAGKTYKVQGSVNTTYTTYAAGNGGESVDLTSSTYSTYSNIIGGTGDDTLKGNSQNNWLVGNLGAKRSGNLSRRQRCATGALLLPLRLAEHPLALAA